MQYSMVNEQIKVRWRKWRAVWESREKFLAGRCMGPIIMDVVDVRLVFGKFGKFWSVSKDTCHIACNFSSHLYPLYL